MSKCEIWFEFDQPERTYAVGDVIGGRVHLKVNKDVTAKRVYLRMEWRTHGRGNKKSGGRDEFDFLGQTMLAAGEDHSFPFQFSAPTGPLTYHGKYLNVDWYLRASVELPWALDPKATEDFVVVRGAPDNRLSQGDETEAWHASLQRSQKVHTAFTLIFGFIFGGIGFLFFCMGVGMMLTKGFSLEYLLPAGMGAVFTMVGLGIALGGAWKKIAGKKIGDVQLLVDPVECRAGDDITCEFKFVPSDVRRIEKVEFRLDAREQCVSGSGTNKSTHIHTFYSQTEDVFPDGEWANGLPCNIEHVFTLPHDAPPSFYAPDNRLQYELSARVHITRWPDYTERVVIRVR